MAPIVADFTLTIEEFTEAYRLQRARRRFLAGAPERSPWIGCAWLGGLFVLGVLATFVAIGFVQYHSTPATALTDAANSRLVHFLVGLLLWPIAGGVLWLLLTRSVIERRLAGRMVVFLLLVGASASLSSALTMTVPTPAPESDSGFSLAKLLPWLIGLCGIIFMVRDIYRQSIRIAWDGQPQLRHPAHFEADEQRLMIQSPLARTQYTWAAVVSFSEGEHIMLLSLSALTFHVIPKRALDGGKLEALRALLQARTVNAQITRQGFEVLPEPVLSLEPDDSKGASAPPPD